ncbi:amidohydrolase [Aquibacillus sp. 3ASR75-11]|uniref:Amidohydrolase n=1 Tax=Terrihalobacillus insolitus TaxID=2950438 RepID=A0A9X4ALQ6_9BACI|nr:amidohydrolase [Terrihalobacillus insolitus]MDC3412664.1 amidohydrolase [Terrihalobacillus insolitus]MDC3424014.1 amidohydrolase [Terrihalobacillus insolitus]
MGMLWYGGKIYTMLAENDFVEAIYVEDGFIKETGQCEELIDKYADNIEVKHHLDGATMFPGFVDSHLHIIGHGERLVHLDLSKMRSKQQISSALKARIESLEEGDWLIGEGWNENGWDQDYSIFTLEELDEICPNHPMVLTRICRHAILANTKAMNESGVTNQSTNPQGGVIVRDDEGNPTGYFLDTAQELIKDAIPSLSEASLTRLVEKSVDDLLKYGLVGGHTEDLNYYGGFLKTFRAFTNAIDGVNRKFKAHLLVHHGVLDDRIQETSKTSLETDYVELGAVKIFADGALGGRTAWLMESYDDESGNVGMAIHPIEELEALVKKARKHDLPVAVHAIGDKAVSVIASILKKYPLTNGKRDRIIHAQIINDEVLELLEEIPVVLDIQPTFVASDFPWVMERIGETRAKNAYPWKTFLARGIRCAGGSDAPIEIVDPLIGVQAAMLRRSNWDGKIYQQDEQLTNFEAISLYTTGSAYAINQEERRGKIAPDYTADFTVFDRDIMTLAPEEVQKANVIFTIVDGEIVYSNRV